MNIKKVLHAFNVKIKTIFLSIKNKDTSLFILALCICILSTTIIWTYSDKNRVNPDNLSTEDQDDDLDEGRNTTYLMDDYIRKVKDDYQRYLQEELEKDKIVDEIDLSDIATPLVGVVIKEYSMDNLVYFETIEEWRVHRGIDIAPEKSLNVYSAYKGRVAQINVDTLMGIAIINDPGVSVKNVYSCLAISNLKEGDYVDKGEQIGKIGQCVGIEMSEGPHLHFEIIINDEPVNPLDYFPNEEE